MSLIEQYNKDDVFVRCILVGLLDLLNNKIEYGQNWDSDNTQIVKIPWFYNFGISNERFMQDHFDFFGQDCPSLPQNITGNFDIIPRGIISLNGVSITSGSINNRFVKGTYNKVVNNKIVTFKSYIYSIPIKCTISHEIKIDNLTTTLKIYQSIVETFYKTQTFYVMFKGMRIGCQIGFPDDYNIDVPLKYSYEVAEKIYKITFQTNIETYLPVPDKTVEKPLVPMSNILVDYTNMQNPTKISNIEITTPLNDSIIPKNIPIMIEWKYTQSNIDIPKVNILYKKDGDSTYKVIEKAVTNNSFYLWNIPDELNNFKQPNLKIVRNNNIKVIKSPIINIVPINGNITLESMYIMDEGTFVNKNNINEYSMDIVFEFMDENYKLVSTPKGDIKMNIKNGIINTDNPFTFINNVVCPVSSAGSVISIRIQNATDEKTYGEVENITIF